jgi:citrate synthase
MENEVHKGLAGVVVDTTAASNVVPETNSLTYRGYPVQELAASCSRLTTGASGRGEILRLKG